MAAMVETKPWRLPGFLGKNRSDDECRRPSPAAPGREISSGGSYAPLPLVCRGERGFLLARPVAAMIGA